MGLKAKVPAPLYHRQQIKKQKQKQKQKQKKKVVMGSKTRGLYFVFMSFDPQYERLRADRSKQGTHELDLYLSNKHEELLTSTLEAESYKKKLSLAIVDGFAVEITDEQANLLRSAKGVRIIEKNQELA